jgi:hypothetical protein
LGMSAIKVAIGLSLFVALSGCEAKKPKPSVASAAPSSVGAAMPPKVAEPPRPAPEDIVLEPLLKSLKCDKKSKIDSCRILNEFAGATRFLPQTPAGEGRWVGNAFVREKGEEKRQLFLLWAKQVPTSQVNSGDLPIRVGTGTLSDDLVEHGFKMVRALSQGDQPSKHNQARPAVEAFVPTTHRGAVNTAGASVRLISEDSVYLRQVGRKVLLVMPNQTQSAAAGDGTYAEFWRATW